MLKKSNIDDAFTERSEEALPLVKDFGPFIRFWNAMTRVVGFANH